jgi:hypothetical protein
MAAILIMALSASCGIADENTQAVPVKPPERLVVDTVGTPVPLPFESKFPNRWNGSNDGTPFEPCVAFSEGELKRFDIDPNRIEDAAMVNGQGIRGCSWFMPARFALSSLVTNSKSMEEYRDGTVENEWMPNLVISNRVVGLFRNAGDASTCSTYVQSYSAAVVTNVVTSMAPEGRSIDPCKLVEDFTRAYIDKIPN